MRHRVNRGRSAKQFKHRSGKTHRKNLVAPMRGGFRL